MEEERITSGGGPAAGRRRRSGRELDARLPDVRLPAVVIVPQFLAPLAVAGDAPTARLVFLIAVAANVPIALAGRVAIGMIAEREAASTAAERWFSSGTVEWSRTLAAWTYAAMLLLLLPHAAPPLDGALRTAAVAVTLAGALAYVVPGRSTPAGLRLAVRGATGAAWAREVSVFTLGRTSRVLPIGVVPGLALGRPVLAFVVMFAAFAAALLSVSLRPRNASGYESRRSEQESTF